MRALACLLFVIGCAKSDAAEKSAEKTAQAQVKVPAALSLAAPSCGGGGEKCGGSCGGGCAAEMATPAPTFAAVPSDARWTELKVEGMHCGGCARRVENALAKVDGVFGVKVDLEKKIVAVATKPGVDAHALAKPPIDALGYRAE